MYRVSVLETVGGRTWRVECVVCNAEGQGWTADYERPEDVVAVMEQHSSRLFHVPTQLVAAEARALLDEIDVARRGGP